MNKDDSLLKLKRLKKKNVRYLNNSNRQII